MPVRLVRIAGTFSDFDGPSGQEVVMQVRNHIGLVFMSSATYNDRQLVPVGTAVSEIRLTIVPGTKTLKIVSVFSASTMGRGELREVAGADSQFLINLPGNDPFQVLRISGKA